MRPKRRWAAVSIGLLLVAAIAILMPSFRKFQRRAKISEGKAILASVGVVQEVFRQEWHSYSESASEIRGYFKPEGTGVAVYYEATELPLPLSKALNDSEKPYLKKSDYLVLAVVPTSDSSEAVLAMRPGRQIEILREDLPRSDQK